MNRFDRIAKRVTTAKSGVLIEQVGRRAIRLYWHYTMPISESILPGRLETCREQTKREAVILAKELGVTLSKVGEPYMKTLVGEPRVVVDVDFSVIPGKEMMWDDVVDVLKEGGWL